MKIQQIQQMNQSDIDSRNDKILLWISKDYYLCKDTELLESPLGNNESIADVVSDISKDIYPNVVALWYNLAEKKITLAFENRKEGGH